MIQMYDSMLFCGIEGLPQSVYYEEIKINVAIDLFTVTDVLLCLLDLLSAGLFCISTSSIFMCMNDQ